jgi:hypothetical protein
MSGGGSQAPIPGKETTNNTTRGTTDVSSTQGTTTSGSSNLSGSQAQTNVSTATPNIPAWALPLMQQATGAYGAALGNINPADLSLSPVPLQQLISTASGDYLTGPQRDEQLAAITRSVLPKVTSAFGGAGRSNNFLGADTAARDISDSYLMNFANPERNRMVDAANAIPGLEMSSFFGPTQQFGAALGQLNPLFAPAIGSTTTSTGTGVTSQESQTQSVINQIIDSLTKSFQSGKGTGTSTPAYFPGNTAASGIGGALSGAGTGAMLGSVFPGIGTGVGALAGGLLGGIGGFL